MKNAVVMNSLPEITANTSEVEKGISRQTAMFRFVGSKVVPIHTCNQSQSVGTLLFCALNPMGNYVALPALVCCFLKCRENLFTQLGISFYQGAAGNQRNASGEW